MARRAQLPEDLVRLAQIQAMPLRQESFTPDAEAIAERVRVVLSRRRSGPPLRVSQRLAAVEQERDEARKEGASANAKIATLQRQLAQNSTLGRLFRDCSNCPELAVVPAGRLLMGSPRDEIRRGDDENDVNGNQVELAVPNSLAVGRFAVTRREFAAFLSETNQSMASGCVLWNDDSGWKLDAARSWNSPGFEQTDTHPATCVNWEDAKAYVGWLSKKTGKSYRLLSEAEREYVTRAGTTTPFWWGPSISPNQANYIGTETYNEGSKKGEYRRKTMPVDSFPPNRWGLYQVHGNVWEWVEDCYHKNYSGMPPAMKDGAAPWITECEKRTSSLDDYRVLRGGAWNNLPQALRSATRLREPAAARYNSVGFRVARTL
jgi:formylglycine-generating enzyme required for sulfatase activity